MLYYIFNDETTATQAEKYISTVGGAPVASTNLKTKQVDPNILTTRWAIPLKRMDGKWVFQFIGEKKLREIPQKTIDEFNSLYDYTLEEFDESWFPDLEEDDDV